MRRHIEGAAQRQNYRYGTKDSHHNWEALPEDILRILAEKSSSGSVLACRLVCKRWNYYFSLCTKELKPKKTSLLHRMQEFPEVQVLNLGRCNGLRTRHMEKLAKSEVPISQLFLGPLFPLKDGRFKAAALTNSAFPMIAQLTSIKFLALSNLQGVTDAGMKSILELPNLNTLYVNGCRRLSAASFRDISNLTNLQCVRLHDNYKIAHDAFAHLGKCNSLRTINYATTAVGHEASLTSLQPLPNLRTLELANFYATPETIQALCQLTALTSLGLSNVKLLIESSAWILDQLKPVFPGLIRLNFLNQGTFDDEVVKDFSRSFPLLQDLKFDLGGDNTPEAIEDLSRLNQLTSLTMNAGDAQDETLGAISRLTNLKVLELPGTHIPITLLEGLVELKTLEKLSLRRGHPEEACRFGAGTPLEFTLSPILVFMCFSSLRCLDLSTTTIKYNQAVDLISRMLSANRKCALEMVILHACSIASEGWAHLRDMFPSVICTTDDILHLSGSTEPWDDALRL